MAATMGSRLKHALRETTPVEWLVFCASGVATALAMWLIAAGRPAEGFLVDDLATSLFLIGGVWLASAVEAFSTKLRVYRVAHVLRIVFLLALMPYVAPDPQVAPIICSAVVAACCLYDSYPWSLGAGLGIVGASAAIRLAALEAIYSFGLLDALQAQLVHLESGVLLAVLGSQFARRREELAEALKDVKRLDSTVIGLTRANLQYQDLANEAEELAMDAERKRITRDIHDVVGYTLTNNIMMMEAATDMMERNPFGVPSLIAGARENAKEGLAQIREALYALRRRTVSRPTGLRALARMTSIYERATGVRVSTGFGTASWQYPEEVDSAIYHLAQEALMNAFRHGKAREVTVIVAENARELTVTVRDDGVGADGYTEGIGLRGMRERLERVGGTLVVDTGHGGFMVRGTIPASALGAGARPAEGQNVGTREDPAPDR